MKQQRGAAANPERKVVRLLLVDDHEMVRIGLRGMIESTEEVEVVGEASTASSAVSEALRLHPDVVLMDVRLPDGNGAEACREIRNMAPQTRVLFLTSFADEHAILTAVTGGADGYLLKEIGRDALLRAIKTVAEGHAVLDPTVTQPFIARMQSGSSDSPPSEMNALSAQERRVLALVTEGKTNKEIAAELELSDKTVKNYLSHAFQKLNVARRAQAAALFARRIP